MGQQNYTSLVYKPLEDIPTGWLKFYVKIKWGENGYIIFKMHDSNAQEIVNVNWKGKCGRLVSLKHGTIPNFKLGLYQPNGGVGEWRLLYRNIHFKMTEEVILK